MSNGCTKADRKRKSAQAMSYKLASRFEINKKKRIAAHKLRCSKQIAKTKVARGTARKDRRFKARSA